MAQGYSTPAADSTKKWVDDAFRRMVGTSVDEVRSIVSEKRPGTRERLLQLVARSGGPLRMPQPGRSADAQVASLARRAGVVIADALSLLGEVHPLTADPAARKAVDTTKRLVRDRLQQLRDELGGVAQGNLVTLLFEELLVNAPDGTPGGLVGRLQEQASLKPRDVDSPKDESSYVAFLALKGHLVCLWKGWDEGRRAPEGGLGTLIADATHHIGCITETAATLRDDAVLPGVPAECFDPVLADPSPDGGAPSDVLTLKGLLAMILRQAGTWRDSLEQLGTEGAVAIAPFVHQATELYGRTRGLGGKNSELARLPKKLRRHVSALIAQLAGDLVALDDTIAKLADETE